MLQGIHKTLLALHLTVIRRRYHRIKKSETGSAALEFALVAPLLIGLLLSMFEAGFVYLKAGMVEASAVQVNRDLYTGLSKRAGLSRNDMINTLCAGLRSIMRCTPENVTLEIRTISGTVIGAEAAACTNSGPAGLGGGPLPVFATPSGGDLIYVRFCILNELLVPGLGSLTFQGINLGLRLPQLPGGRYGLVHSSVFRLEPF